MSAAGQTRDGFLDNRLVIVQPRKGFRAGHDSVLLAAAVPAKAGDAVLELGAGAGIASLCLGFRVPGCKITGVEADPALVELANANAKANGMAERVHFVAGDARTYADGQFGHVFFNPPFYPADGNVSPVAARARAKSDEGDAPERWTEHAGALLREEGVVTLILRADRLEAWRARVAGEAAVLPLAPREDKAAKRVIIRWRPGTPSLRTLPPFVLHEADGRPTKEAEAVLRGSAALDFATGRPA